VTKGRYDDLMAQSPEMAVLLSKEETMINKDEEQKHVKHNQHGRALINSERRVSETHVHHKSQSHTSRSSLPHATKAVRRSSSIQTISGKSRSSISSEMSDIKITNTDQVSYDDDYDDEYDEKRDTGAIGWKIYINYITAAFGFIAPIILMLLFLITQGLLVGADYWVSNWYIICSSDEIHRVILEVFLKKGTI
jgi:hypothetical protein